MAELKNELSWSFSRKRLFDSCRRRYFYQTYLKWGGWDSRAPEESKVAYRLSKMTTISMLAGELVHSGIEDALRRFKQNHIIMEAEELIKTARIRWDRAIAESRSRRWIQDPKHNICLVEDYYENTERDRLLEEAWDKIAICLANFAESKTWADLQKTRTGGWLAMDSDPFKSVLIEDIPTFGRPDLAYDASKPDRSASRCWVFDWKSGKPSDADVLQVRFYALYAESLWGFASEDVKARLIYLFPETVEQDVDVTPAGLEDARRTMVESFQEMKSVLADVDQNIPLDISHFPTTTRVNLCRQCSFQEICTDRSASQPTPTPAPAKQDDPFV